MKPETQEPGIKDRISTRQELDQVIVQLVKLHQLSLDDTLEPMESSGEPSQENDLELWTDGDRNGQPAAEIESLTSIILGCRQLCN